MAVALTVETVRAETGVVVATAVVPTAVTRRKFGTSAWGVPGNNAIGFTKLATR
jgi:hypothetical protein